MRKRLSFEQVVLFGFGAVLAILLVVGWISYTSTSQFLHASRAGIRNAALLIPLENALAAVYEAESTQRGYLLTGSEHYLDRNVQAVQRVREALTQLSEAAATDSRLTAQVEQIAGLANARLAVLAEVLDARLANGPETARDLLTSGRGQPEMERLSSAVTSLVAERQARLAANAAAVDERGGVVLRTFFAAIGFVMLLLLTLMTLVAREMRHRRQAADALADSEARLHAVVDTAVDGLIVIDERGRMESVNRAAERMFGYASADILGRNVSMLMPNPYRDEHDGYLQRYLRTGEKRIIGIGREAVAQRSDGSVFPIDLAVAEFRVGGQRRFSGLVRDISERKQAEARQAQLVQELAAANEELTNFAYVASHDLKAPLRAIASLADWISVDYADKFDEDGKEQMRLLIGRVRRMDQLINGILQYSRVGRVREERVAVDLNRLLAEVIDLLAPPAHIHVAVAPLPTVVLEPTRLQQVFQNLLSNAIQYLDKPVGEIAVAAEPVGREWHFHVRDNGPGIEARHRERIFQLFQTLQPRDRSESTGIGLSLVKKIVELYGGRVWLESTPGEGSTFSFSLPAAVVRSGGAKSKT